MRKYNVYGMGNALLDMEYEVSAELLQELKVDKGVMTLIAEDRQTELMQQLKDLPCKRSCGGSAANTIVAISQFGGKCFYSCKVANDEIGTFYLEDLVRCGVDTNLQLSQEREAGISGQCLVFVTPDADRTMNTYLGISGGFSHKELVPEAIADSQYLYIEGYLVADPNGKEAAIKAREIAHNAGNQVALSLSDLNMVKFFEPGLKEIIGSGIDLLFANEVEALAMADTEDFATAVERLKPLAKRFAITRGAEGSLIFDGETVLEIEAAKVKAVDTVGAGDMYAGAFLYGITHGMSCAQAGKLASLASGRLVTNLGPRMATEDVQAMLQEV